MSVDSVKSVADFRGLCFDESVEGHVRRDGKALSVEVWKEGDCVRNWFRRCRFGVVTAVVLTLFTAYAVLDVFVIPHEYRAENDTEAGQEIRIAKTEPTGAVPSEPVITDRSYTDANISVEISEYRVNDTDVYVADVRVSSPEYLLSALAKGMYGRNVTEKTSEIAGRVDAILAVNGDYYGARNAGYVIRNGVLYRDRSAGNEDLVMYEDGTFAIIDESKVSASQLIADGAVQVWSFGPGLVENGEIMVSAKQEVGRAMASNPRTAIAYVEENHYLLVVADGRTGESDGLSLYELASFLCELGVQTAYNLDGGGSSTMVFLGKVVNNPTTGGQKISERSVSDIVCIGY